MQVTFLDHNATTKLCDEALAKMTKAYKFPLNSASAHSFGKRGYSYVEEARNEIKTLLNGENYDIIFTGSATEASNQVLFKTQPKNLFFCKFEHSAVFECRPAHKNVTEIEALPSGLIDIADLEKKLEKITDGDFLVSVMLANNETGAIQPVKEIAKLVHKKGGLMHCDMVQALQKIDIDIEDLNVDFASISAHKINGPQGVGALLVRKGQNIDPLIHGGKQENYKRAGTTNVAGIAGFGAAAKISKAKGQIYQNEVRKLRDDLESQLKKVAGDDVKFFADGVERLPNTSYIGLKGIDSQTQLINLDLNRICVSAGPACSSGTMHGSKVLLAMNVEPEFASSAIRISLCDETTKDEVDHFIEIWTQFYTKIKEN